MKKIALALVSFALLQSTVSYAQNKAATTPAADTTKKVAPKPGITEKVKSSKKLAGLFTLYQDTATGSVQMYIRKDQLDKNFIYQSFSLSGPTSLFLNQSMHRSTLLFKMKKSFDKIEFSVVNTNFYYNPENAVSKAANVDVADAVFYTDKFSAEDSTGYLISVDQLFLSDKLDPVKPVFPPTIPSYLFFNLGGFNSTKSKVSNVRSYPNNTDVIVDLAYDNPVPYNGGGKDITDARYVRIKLQHSFLEVPVNDFKPRFDDPRVGFFTQEVDDLTSNDVNNYRDVINRWHLKKKDPSAAISEPVEPIVYWIENTTPVQFRNIIKAAGERWNEAFEKAGFKNAVVMKIMPDTATWDPADIRYNVIRWVSSAYPSYGAIGPSFVNPLTGQILGTDITIEWKSGSAIPYFDVLEDNNAPTQQNLFDQLPPEVKKHWLNCNIGAELAKQFMAGSTLIATSAADGGETEIRKAHEQFLYYLVLHEMGHTLGLNHNMKASQMLSPAEVNNTSITQKKGLQGSVMDYPAINISSNRNTQGDYYTMKPGPYDLWAIEFGYKEFPEGQEASGLKTILSRSNEHDLLFGNDADDMRSPGNGIDPRVMINDMSSDMVAYGEDRYKFVNNSMSKLLSKFTRSDKSYQQIQIRYAVLNSQRFQMANAISRYIGGVQVDRSFPGQNPGGKPFIITPVEYQKKAMTFLNKYVFAPTAFDVDIPLLPYLQVQRRGYNFFGATEDPKHTSVVLNFQMNILSELLNAVTMRRITNSALYGNTYTVADVLNDLTNGIFKTDIGGVVNVYRQNLQTEYVKGLIAIVESKTGYDNAARSGAYNSLRKIKSMVAVAPSPNESTKAHRSMLLFLIDKALATK